MPHLCEEVTATSGATAPGGPHYVLGGASSNARRPISEGMADGDRSGFVVFAAGSPMQFEVFEGQYDSATNSVIPLVVRDSSNGGSSEIWPASGTRNIYPSAFANPLEPLTDPAAPFGMMARTSQYSYAALTLASSAEFLGWSNPNGVGGNPIATATYLPVRRNAGGTEAQYTIDDELVLAALSTKITGFSGGAVSSHYINGPGGDADGIIQLHRIGTHNYGVYLGIGNGWNKILTDADTLVDFATATSVEGAVANTVRDQTTVSVTTPALGGPFHIAVDSVLHGSCSLSSSVAGAGSVISKLQGGVGTSFADLDLAELLMQNVDSSFANASATRQTLHVFYDLPAALASTVYQFRILPVISTSGSGASPGFTPPAGAKHRIRAAIYTRAS